MKLSEAIRLGALLRPQTFGRSNDGIGTCAFGAALDAAGSEYALAEWRDCWQTVCPACHNQQRHLDNYKFNTVAHLNDTHRWTREQIADWVETIEQQQAPEALQALSLVGVGIE